MLTKTTTDKMMAGAAIGGLIFAVLAIVLVSAMETDVITAFLIGLMLGFCGSGVGMYIAAHLPS